MSTPISSGSPDWLRTMADCNCRCGDDDDAAGLEAAADRIDQLERENAALREAGHLAEKIIVQRTDEIRHLERENAALRAVYQAAKLLTDYDHEGAEMGWPDWDDRFGWLKSAIDAARAKQGGAT